MQPKFFGDPQLTQTEQEVPFINLVRIESKYNENDYLNTANLIQDIAQMFRFYTLYKQSDPVASEKIREAKQYFDDAVNHYDLLNKPLVSQAPAPVQPFDMLTRQPSYPASKSLGKHSSRDSKAGKKATEL